MLDTIASYISYTGMEFLERLKTGWRNSSLAETIQYWSMASHLLVSLSFQGSPKVLCWTRVCFVVHCLNLDSTAHLFADDTKIYMALKNDDNACLLQQDLNTLAGDQPGIWNSTHPSTCEVITISVKGYSTMHQYFLHGKKLGRVDAVTLNFNWTIMW